MKLDQLRSASALLARLDNVEAILELLWEGRESKGEDPFTVFVGVSREDQDAGLESHCGCHDVFMEAARADLLLLFMAERDRLRAALGHFGIVLPSGPTRQAGGMQ